jgi:probable O-glycosylation ligase (exosortase A-associated)
MLLWTIALCLGFYGFKGGLFGLLSGGAVILRGPGGMLEDNNDFALALVMNIPLLFYLGRSEKRREIRLFCDVTIMLSMITILLTHSRGGFLALVGALLVIAWRSGRLTQAIFALLVLTLGFFAFAPQHVIDRILSIGIEGADSSVQARFNSWTIALRMVVDNPWFGVGLRNFQEHFFTYGSDLIDPNARFAHVAHNSYLQIWAEGGTIAFVVYLFLLTSVFVSCWKIRSVSKNRPDLSWAFDYARMMEATTVGFMIGAMFLNRGHFDLIYHWLGIVTCLILIVRAQLKVIPEAEGRKPIGVELRWRSAQRGPRMLPTWGR